MKEFLRAIAASGPVAVTLLVVFLASALFLVLSFTGPQWLAAVICALCAVYGLWRMTPGDEPEQ